MGERGQKVQKNCQACGALISVRLADHKRGWGRFCDKACAAAHKCGQRPRDVNKHHAKFSIWAQDTVARKEAAGGVHQKAPSIKEQIGKNVKIKPLYHSPAQCRECGVSINGPGLCMPCEGHFMAMDDMEEGWDGHKVWTE